MNSRNKSSGCLAFIHAFFSKRNRAVSPLPLESEIKIESKVDEPIIDQKSYIKIYFRPDKTKSGYDVVNNKFYNRQIELFGEPANYSLKQSTNTNNTFSYRLVPNHQLIIHDKKADQSPRLTSSSSNSPLHTPHSTVEQPHTTTTESSHRQVVMRDELHADEDTPPPPPPKALPKLRFRHSYSSVIPHDKTGDEMLTESVFVIAPASFGGRNPIFDDTDPNFDPTPTLRIGAKSHYLLNNKGPYVYLAGDIGYSPLTLMDKTGSYHLDDISILTHEYIAELFKAVGLDPESWVRYIPDEKEIANTRRILV